MVGILLHAVTVDDTVTPTERRTAIGIGHTSNRAIVEIISCIPNESSADDVQLLFVRYHIGAIGVIVSIAILNLVVLSFFVLV